MTAAPAVTTTATLTRQINPRELVSVQVKAASVVATLGFIPPTMGAIMRVRFFDLLSHHRRSVLKRNRLPGGRAAQKMIAANFRRYSRSAEKASASDVFNVVGEGFMRASNKATWITPDLFLNLERGKRIVAHDVMFMPIMAGLKVRNLQALMDAGELDVVPRPGRAPLLVRYRLGGRRHGNRIDVMGVLSRVRKQRALLGFFQQFDSVLPLHLAKMDRSLDRCLTEAGQAANALEIQQVGRGTEDTFWRRIKKYGYSWQSTPECQALMRRIERAEKADYSGGAA